MLQVYVGMAFHEGDFVLGMVVPEHGCCYIPYGGEAVSKELYFVSIYNFYASPDSYVVGVKVKVIEFLRLR